MPELLPAIQLLIDHETIVGDLYKEYSIVFTEHADFWHEISEEEYEHAHRIKILGNEIAQRNAHFHQEKSNSIT